MPVPDDKDRASSQQPGRRSQRQQQTRARLVAGARNIFARVGVAEATIAQITTEADIGFGTFYLYFKTKDDALHAVLVEGFASLNALVDAIQRHADEQQLPWEDTLTRIVVAYLRFAHENRDLMQIMLVEQIRDQQTEWQVFLRFAWRIVQVLRHAQPAFAQGTPTLDSIPPTSSVGMIAYPLNLLTTMIVSMLHRVAIWWLRQNPVEGDEGSHSLDAVGALVAQFMIAGLSSVLTTDPDSLTDSNPPRA